VLRQVSWFNRLLSRLHHAKGLRTYPAIVERPQHNRIRDRLKRLRERLPGMRNEWQADKDFDHVTGDRPWQMRRRVFHLGEVFWCERHAVGALARFEGQGTHVPALVVRRTESEGQSVPVAPGFRDPLPAFAAGAQACFCAEEEPAWSERERRGALNSTFCLDLWRPVSRDRFGAPMAMLRYGDRARLAAMMQEVFELSESGGGGR
jgi:hypothetical protein